MERLREMINISFLQLEQILFQELRKEFCESFSALLERLDDQIHAACDKNRYEVLEKVSRGVETLVGTVRFRRRCYLDRAEVARLLHTCGTPVLDVGIGSGEMAEAIALDGHEVVGIDKSSKAIAIARARVQLPNAKFIQADATNLPFEECSFAAAVCYLSLHHFRDPFPVLDEVLRVLRAGGTFIIVEYQDLLRRLLYAIDACSTRFQAHPMGGFSISSLLVEIYRRFDVQKVVHYPMLVMLVSKKPACCL